MSTPSRRTFTHAAVLLGAGLFALGGVSLIPPLRALERWMVKSLSRTVDPANGEIILDGNGSQNAPWTRRKSVPPPVHTPPRLLNIDDDPEGYFSTSPLAPTDHSVIFASLSEAGHKILGVGHLMAWDQPETLSIEALRKQLDRFDTAVLALPLARGAVSEPVAAPFLRWSILESDVQGNVSALPQVNRIAVPEAEQGGTKTAAGFSLLENEGDPGDDVQPLLARWGDRIVFSFPLAMEIASEGLPYADPEDPSKGLSPTELIIHVGKDIRIGKAGPVIQIDEFGRGAVLPGVEAIETPAKRIVSEGAEPPKSKPLLTRDIRAGLSAADKAWSDLLPGRIQALRTAPRYQSATLLPRPDALVELLMVSLLALAGTAASALGSVRWRIVAAAMTAGLGFELLYLFAARQDAWLPPLAMLCPGLIALGLSFRKSGPRHAPVSDVSPETPAEPESFAPLAPPLTSEPAPDLPTDTPGPFPTPMVATTSRSPAQPEPKPEPEPEVVSAQTVTELGFPAEYAWDPAPATAPQAPPAEPAASPAELSEEPPPASGPGDPPPTKKSVRKTAKKAAAKKAAKKTPAKKAARKSARKPATDESDNDPAA